MKHYTLTEAGALIGRSSSTLKHQAQKGKLRARLFGKTWMVTDRELRRYASAHRTPPLEAGVEVKPRTSNAPQVAGLALTDLVERTGIE